MWGWEEMQKEGEMGRRSSRTRHNRPDMLCGSWGATSSSELLESEVKSKKRRQKAPRRPTWSLCHGKEVWFPPLDKEKLLKGFEKSDVPVWNVILESQQMIWRVETGEAGRTHEGERTGGPERHQLPWGWRERGRKWKLSQRENRKALTVDGLVGRQREGGTNDEIPVPCRVGRSGKPTMAPIFVHAIDRFRCSILHGSLFSWPLKTFHHYSYYGEPPGSWLIHPIGFHAVGYSCG